MRPSQDRSRIEVDGLLQLEIVDNEGKVNIFEQTHSISRLGLGGFDPLVEQGFSLAGVDSILGQLVGLGEALGQCAVADQIAVSHDGGGSVEQRGGAGLYVDSKMKLRKLKHPLNVVSP